MTRSRPSRAWPPRREAPVGAPPARPGGADAGIELEGLTGARLEAIVAIWRREGRQLTARFGGSSMTPSIPAGTEVVLRCGAAPAPGDVAAFLFRGAVIVHRVVARAPDGAWLLTRGDATAIPDPPLPPAAVIGTVVKVARGAGWIDPPPPPRSLGRRATLALCRAVLGWCPAAARPLIGLLWELRRWLVLAPRALARRLRG